MFQIFQIYQIFEIFYEIYIKYFKYKRNVLDWSRYPIMFPHLKYLQAIAPSFITITRSKNLRNILRRTEIDENIELKISQGPYDYD